MKLIKIFIYIFTFIVLLSVLLWYLNQTVIPQKLKTFLISTVEKQTSFSINIQNLKFSLIKGLEFENVEIFKKGDAEHSILKVKKAYLKPLLIPSLRKLRVVIPGVLLKSAIIKIERDASGNWNFQKDISTAKAESTSQRFSISILRVAVTDGAIIYNDSFQERQINETLTDVNASFGLSLPHSLSLLLNAKIYQCPITIKGKIANPFKAPKTTLRVVSELDLKNIEKLNNMGILQGLAKIRTDVYSEPDGATTAKTSASLQSLKFTPTPMYWCGGLHLEGNFDIDAQLEANIKTSSISSYRGNIKFKKATVGFSDAFAEINNAAGEIIFLDNSFTIKNFVGNLANSPVSLNGRLDYSAGFADIDINILVKTVNLDKLIQSLPQATKEKFKQINLEGMANLNINIASKKDAPGIFLYKGDLKISDANLGCPWLQEKIKALNCNLLFEKDTLSWNKLSFIYKDVSYISSGTASNVATPLISAVIESQDFKAKGIVKIEDDLLIIQSLGIAHKNYSIDAKGTLRDFKQPFVDIEGHFSLDLENAKIILAKYKDDIEKINPKGTVNTSFILKGLLREPLSWDLRAKAKLDKIALGRFNLGKAFLVLKMEDKFINIPALAFYPYGGIIDITASLNLKSQEKPYLINMDVKDIDLKNFIADSKFSKSKVRGILLSKATLNGYFDNKDSLKGNGWVQVSEGYLGEFPVVYGLLDTILGIPPEYLTLKDAFGNFAIQNKRIYTTDFKMLSERAALVWEGSLGFDGSLDFGITGRFAEDITKMTTSLGKIASAILHEAGAYIVEVRLSGTVEKPQYKIVPFPIQKIVGEKVIDKFRDVLGDIFE